MFAYVKAPEKTDLEIHFVYLGNKEINCILQTWCIIHFIVHKIFIS